MGSPLLAKRTFNKSGLSSMDEKSEMSDSKGELNEEKSGEKKFFSKFSNSSRSGGIGSFNSKEEISSGSSSRKGSQDISEEKSRPIQAMSSKFSSGKKFFGPPKKAVSSVEPEKKEDHSPILTKFSKLRTEGPSSKFNSPMNQNKLVKESPSPESRQMKEEEDNSLCLRILPSQDTEQRNPEVIRSRWKRNSMAKSPKGFPNQSMNQYDSKPKKTIINKFLEKEVIDETKQELSFNSKVQKSADKLDVERSSSSEMIELKIVSGENDEIKEEENANHEEEENFPSKAFSRSRKPKPSKLMIENDLRSNTNLIRSNNTLGEASLPSSQKVRKMNTISPTKSIRGKSRHHTKHLSNFYPRRRSIECEISVVDSVEFVSKRHQSLKNREISFERIDKRHNSVKIVHDNSRRSILSIDLRRKINQKQTFENKGRAEEELFDEDYFDFEFERRAHSDTDLKEIDLENKNSL